VKYILVRTVYVTVSVCVSVCLSLAAFPHAGYQITENTTFNLIGFGGVIKPRLHDTTGCQFGCQTGLTTGCIVHTNIHPVVKPV